jgi:hypothetical protein
MRKAVKKKIPMSSVVVGEEEWRNGDGLPVTSVLS